MISAGAKQTQAAEKVVAVSALRSVASSFMAAGEGASGVRRWQAGRARAAQLR
jgi:hypothetical protein